MRKYPEASKGFTLNICSLCICEFQNICFSYFFSNDVLFCFYYHTQEKRGSLTDQTNKEDGYIKKGFSSWKKAPKCFYEYQNSSCHKATALYYLVVPQCADVGELMDSQLIQRRQLDHKYLLEVTKCLRYLSRQGIPLQEHNNHNNFTQLLYLLGTKDKNIMDPLDGKVGHIYNTMMGEMNFWTKWEHKYYERSLLLFVAVGFFQ